MRIHRLALKNFKCFKEVDVSFSKITLLTGENSSGKSSLIYGILVPIQSISSYGNSFPLYLSLNKNYANLGGFEDVSFNHNLSNKLGIDLELSTDYDKYRMSTLWQFDTKNKSLVLNCMGMANSSYKYVEVKKTDDIHYVARFHFIDRYSCFDKTNLSFQTLDDIVNYSNNEFGSLSNDVHGKIDLDDEYIEDKFNFIGSFRSNPERTYYQSKSNGKINKDGDGYIDQILDWNDKQSEKLYELVSLLKTLKILYDVKPRKLSGGRFELRVKVKGKSKWESLTDVGFGVSQFLPIIVADLQLQDNSTLIMSQPEIHLHPSVQANLGNYLVKQVKERNKNYIVETHSEYLLNRMRLLIVKGEILPEDVAVYYFENSIKDGSIAHRIEFAKDGRILNAPKGFFETYMIDTMDIALNAW
jgi:predicted ATPase